MNQQQMQIQIKANDEELKGRYANVVQIMHNPEEFALDFFLALSPSGQLVSRILMSPGHMKRLARVLEENIRKYEEITGQKVEEAIEPKAIGFKAN